MESRPWHSVWPDWAPKSIEYPEEPLYAPILSAARDSPGRCALVQAETGACYTYESLVSTARRVAAWVEGTGRNVVFAAWNNIEAAAALLGAWMGGARVIAVDPLTTGEDLEFQLEGRRVDGAILSPEFYARERGRLEKLGISKVLVLSPTWEGEAGPTAMTGLPSPSEWREPSIKPREDTAVVFYYSGIAGRTMQTLHSHYGVLSSTIAYNAMLGLDRVNSLNVAPLTHILGLQAGILASLYTGGTSVLMRRWNPALALQVLGSSDVNYLPGAPMMHESLVEEARRSGVRPRALRLGASGGAPLKPEVQDAYRETLGAPLVQLYGMTETWIITFQPVNIADVKGTVGIPLPDVDVVLADPEDPRRILGRAGQTGELLVKAPWVMQGYEDEEENKNVFVDGWLRTGDILYMDERGLLYFRGVKKRMIKYKAYPIFPRDLELILEKHPAVAKAYVYGIPDPDVGHIPAAKVVLKEEYKGKVTEEELMDYVNSRVAFYKKVRRLEIVESL